MTRENYKRKLKLKAQKFLENHRHITDLSSAPSSPTSRSGEEPQHCSGTRQFVRSSGWQLKKN